MSEPMKVLTLWQPHASLVSLGVKTIETRGWSTKYRGPLAIHAAAKVPFPVRPRGVKWEAGRWAMWHADVTGPGWTLQPQPDCTGGVFPLPLGAIVATCTLVDVVPIRTVAPWSELPMPCIANGPSGTDRQRGIGADRLRHLWMVDGLLHSTDVTDQRPYGDFTPGRFAWLLADIVPVDPPVSFKGGQGLMKTWMPDEVSA